MALQYAHVEGQDSAWHAGSVELPASGGKIMMAAEGVIILLDSRFWSVYNTGYYDSGGTDTANAVDAWVRTSIAAAADAPNLTYAASDGPGRASIPVNVGQERLFRPPSDIATGYNLTKPGFYLYIKPKSGTLTVLITPNEYISKEGQK